MAIFNSYVKLPEGKFCHISSDFWFWDIGYVGYPPGYPDYFNKITSITSIHGGVGCCEAPLRRGFSSSDGRKLGPLAGVKVLDMTRVLAGPGSHRVNHRWICLSHFFQLNMNIIIIYYYSSFTHMGFPMDFPSLTFLRVFFYRQDHAARRSWAIWAPRSSSWSDPKWATTPEALRHPSCQGPKRTAGGRWWWGLEDSHG